MDYLYKGAFSTDIIDGKEIVWVKGNVYKDLNPKNKKIGRLIQSKYLIQIAETETKNLNNKEINKQKNNIKKGEI